MKFMVVSVIAMVLTFCGVAMASPPATYTAVFSFTGGGGAAYGYAIPNLSSVAACKKVYQTFAGSTLATVSCVDTSGAVAAKWTCSPKLDSSGRLIAPIIPECG